jgi:hypothetical protein
LRISEIADFGKVDLVGSGRSFYDKPSVAVRVSGFITCVIAAGTGVLGVVFFSNLASNFSMFPISGLSWSMKKVLIQQTPI